MEVALGSAASLLGKVLTTLSDDLMAAYLNSLQLGHSSEQIRDKLLHAQGLLHNALGGHNPGLQRLLEKLSRDADQAEDLLDELHYFQIHDKLHATHYATTQEAGPDLDSHYATTQETGPDLDSLVRHQALHARSALRHTLGSLVQCFSCSRTQDGSDDDAADSAFRADGDDTLHFDRMSMSSKIKSLLQGMESHCDSVSYLLGTIPSNSTAVVLNWPQTVSMIIQDTLYGRTDTFEETVNRITIGGATQTVSVLPIVGPGGIGKTTFTQHLYNDARTRALPSQGLGMCIH